MLRSMGLLLVVAVPLVWLGGGISGRNTVEPVDYRAMAVGLQQSAEYELVVPELPAAWQATSARFEPVPDDISHHSWHVGLVGPDGKYRAIEQSDTALPGHFIRLWAAGYDKAAQPVSVGGREWTVYIKSSGDAVYVAKLASSWLCVVTDQTPAGQTLVQAVARAIAA